MTTSAKKYKFIHWPSYMDGWAEKHAWILEDNAHVRLGYYDQNNWFHSPPSLAHYGEVQYLKGTGWLYSDTHGVYPIRWTPSSDMTPFQYDAWMAAPTASAPAKPAPQPQRPATRPHPTQSATRPAPQQVRPGRPAPQQVRPGRPAPQQVRPQSTHSAGRRWHAAGNPAHAYIGSRDLGILVNDRQVVQPTGGGRLWALYNLRDDGTMEFVDRFGSVPGAPPPPNAHLNNVPAQFYPPPSPAPVYAAPPQPQYMPPPPPPTYGYPEVYGAPAGVAFDASMGFAAPESQSGYGYAQVSIDPGYYQPQFGPAPMAAPMLPMPPQYTAPVVPQYTAPVYEMPQYAPPPPPQMDPTTAAYYGAAAGAQQAIAQLEAQDEYQQQQEQLAEIMGGGGGGGIDPNDLALLAGMGVGGGGMIDPNELAMLAGY